MLCRVEQRWSEERRTLKTKMSVVDDGHTLNVQLLHTRGRT